MIQGTDIAAQSDPAGNFLLDAASADLSVRKITAWKVGYAIGAESATAEATSISLAPLPPDNAGHSFQPAALCGSCHDDIFSQ